MGTTFAQVVAPFLTIAVAGLLWGLGRRCVLLAGRVLAGWEGWGEYQRVSVNITHRHCF